MKPEWEQRADRLDQRLNRHIEFVAKVFDKSDKKLDRHIEFVTKNFVRLDKKLDRHIEYATKNFTRLDKKLNQGFAEVRFALKALVTAQKKTELVLQKLIHRVDRLETRND